MGQRLCMYVDNLSLHSKTFPAALNLFFNLSSFFNINIYPPYLFGALGWPSASFLSLFSWFLGRLKYTKNCLGVLGGKLFYNSLTEDVLPARSFFHSIFFFFLFYQSAGYDWGLTQIHFCNCWTVCFFPPLFRRHFLMQVVRKSFHGGSNQHRA